MKQYMVRFKRGVLVEVEDNATQEQVIAEAVEEANYDARLEDMYVNKNDVISVEFVGNIEAFAFEPAIAVEADKD